MYRNQTGVYERTLHDREIVTPNHGKSSETIGETVYIYCKKAWQGHNKIITFEKNLIFKAAPAQAQPSK